MTQKNYENIVDYQTFFVTLPQFVKCHFTKMTKFINCGLTCQ